MKRQRIWTTFTVVLCLAFLLCGCSGITPDGDGDTATTTTAPPTTTTTAATTTTVTTTTTTSSTVAEKDLTAAQLAEIETFLNQPENNGFVSMNFYTRPEEISLLAVFYCAAGIGTRGIETWSEQEKADILAVWGREEFRINPLKFDRQKGNTLLLAKTGLSLEDFGGEVEGYTYVEKYDAYYSQISDSNEIDVRLYDGYIDSDGLYTVFFEDPYLDKKVKVTLRKVSDGYQFISCILVEEASDR